MVYDRSAPWGQGLFVPSPASGHVASCRLPVSPLLTTTRAAPVSRGQERGQMLPLLPLGNTQLLEEVGETPQGTGGEG